MKATLFGMIVVSFLCVTTTYAEQSSNTVVSNDNADTTSTALSLSAKAKMWHLTTEQYHQYLHEMKNTPSGHWWKNIDPPQVLGMNAKTDAERMAYAKIDVQLDHSRASSEIAFQHAYSEAFATLYPNAKLIGIDTSANAHRDTVNSNDVFDVFMAIADPEGALMAGKIISKMQSVQNLTLNIYFVGNASTHAIKRWARLNTIPNHLPNGNQITLNHNQLGDNNMMHQILQSTAARLPLVVRIRGGKTSIVGVRSL